jgi:DNA (cytosine-5)-methyltransferase 1
MARIIHEVRPGYVFVENSPMLTSRGLGRVLGDLAAMGFDARWGVLGAADVGAPHQRDRIWIVAKWRGHFSHTQHDRIRRWEQQQKSIKTTHQEMAYSDFIGLDESKTKRDRINKQQICQNQLDYGNEIRGEAIGCSQLGNEKELANPTSIRLEGQGKSEQPINSKTYGDWEASQSANVRESNFWSIEPSVGRVVNGMASRVDRIKALGNGQVPLCAATAWRILSESL